MPSDAVRFRQSLLKILEAAAPAEERLLKSLEAHREQGQPVNSSLLSILTHLSFSEAEARRHWRRIAAHRDLLRMQLGRDVGLRVALLDYFVNVNKELRNPKVIEIAIYERTERSAVTDGLTGLYNHNYFLQSLKREVQRSRRHGLTLSVAFFDLDDFKQINDGRGHVEGDRVLVKTAALLQENLREIDIAARYGGEEFAAILPETGRQGAFVVADRVRARIEEHFGRRRGGVKVTISGGIASFPDDATSVEDLVRRADEGLYRSKAAGKNRITVFEGERRRHPRVAMDCPATVRVREGRPTAARAKNVSENGLLLAIRQPVTIGSALNLVIRPKGGAAVPLRGEVVRVGRRDTDGLLEVGVRLRVDAQRALAVFRRLTASAAGGA
jgi:diguanylate cyclase (GGDEF)-like protein